MSIRVLQGNCLDRIEDLSDNSIDCVVSSPPYYGLRDYGTAQWDGGDSNCEHTISHDNDNLKPNVDRPTRGDRSFCLKCGAKRIDEQIGLEPTIADYINNTIRVFEAMQPKLKDTATIWWNVGDSYNSTNGFSRNKGQYKRKGRDGGSNDKKLITGTPIKEKDLMMITNRVAIALQDAGWYIRSEIIWHKPNPMPQSVKDRPTSAHEKIWLITKNKKYYYDAEAIKEDSVIDGKRNKRNVWTVTTKPCKHAHFATFPKDLIEPCILAGCPIDGTVLDPFGGSGTVGIVAENNNRNSVLIELNPEYIDIMNVRFSDEITYKLLD